MAMVSAIIFPDIATSSVGRPEFCAAAAARRQ